MSSEEKNVTDYILFDAQYVHRMKRGQREEDIVVHGSFYSSFRSIKQFYVVGTDVQDVNCDRTKRELEKIVNEKKDVNVHFENVNSVRLRDDYADVYDSVDANNNPRDKNDNRYDYADVYGSLENENGKSDSTPKQEGFTEISTEQRQSEETPYVDLMKTFFANNINSLQRNNFVTFVFIVPFGKFVKMNLNFPIENEARRCNVQIAFVLTFENIEQEECERRKLTCLLYTSPSPRDRQKSRMPSSA